MLVTSLPAALASPMSGALPAMAILRPSWLGRQRREARPSGWQAARPTLGCLHDLSRSPAAKVAFSQVMGAGRGNADLMVAEAWMMIGRITRALDRNTEHPVPQI